MLNESEADTGIYLYLVMQNLHSSSRLISWAFVFKSTQVRSEIFHKKRKAHIFARVKTPQFLTGLGVSSAM